MKAAGRMLRPAALCCAFLILLSNIPFPQPQGLPGAGFIQRLDLGDDADERTDSDPASGR